MGGEAAEISHEWSVSNSETQRLERKLQADAGEYNNKPKSIPEKESVCKVRERERAKPV